ncbi:MAG: hypothetical protein J6V32_02885 [Elusimicrobiaceae bacterium]|nr:hypothetical protein [Elusimicrobiaceae bacterium]
MADKPKNNKKTNALKKGFQDIQTVLQEGNFKLFVKQFILVLGVFLLFRYLTGQFAIKEQEYRGQIEAINVQKKNEKTYLSNKEKLLELEPLFPDISSKTEWLLSQILGIYQSAGLAPEVSGSQTENTSNPAYVATSLQVKSAMEFDKLGEFLASIENRPEFVRVSEITLEKDMDKNRLGMNKVSMKFNTVFPKEKISKTLFRDQNKRGASSAKKGKLK